MKTRVIAAAFGLFALASVTCAHAQIVHWDRVEGFGAADVSAIFVGPIQASRPRTVGAGTVVANLDTGFLWFAVRGMTNGNQYDNGPLGAGWGVELMIGTLVCDSTQRFAPATWVDTPSVRFDANGDGRFAGLVVVPAACKQRPEEMVFLLRHFDRPGQRFVAYGAGRRIESGRLPY
ncbi:MAG: hypothetical protein JSR54_11425 [Proteobacteria bacterium]|nr:hypothetical protein [Pseudomonadota bacterium]